MFDPQIIIGLDLSLNHFGLVVLTPSGTVRYGTYVWPVSKYIIPPFEVGCGGIVQGFLLPRKDDAEQSDNYTQRRIHWMSERVKQIIGFYSPSSTLADPSQYLLAVEDYAFGVGMSGSTGLTQIAELTGLVKNFAYNNDGAVRLFDPMTVKMFATGAGNSLKRHVVEAAEKEQFVPDPQLFHKVNKMVRGYPDHDLDGPGSDLCDAYFLARMAWTELQVRQGKIQLHELPEHVREKIFLRVTKARPINILAREYIQRKG